MPVFARSRRPSPTSPRLAAALVALACAGTTTGALAAAEDINAEAVAVPEAPAAPSAASRVAAFGRRVLDGFIASEHAVVDAITANASAGAPPASTSTAPWRRATGAALLDGRSAALAARASAAADAAADPALRGTIPSDNSFGARFHVLQGDADTHVPAVAWMADVQPASGVPVTQSSALRPSMHLSAEWALGDAVSLGVMPGFAMDVDRVGRRYATGTLAVTLGKEWVPGVSTYVDLSRDRLAIEQGGGVSRSLDAGLTVVTGANSQVDFAVAHGLTAAAPAFQAGVGVSSQF